MKDADLLADVPDVPDEPAPQPAAASPRASRGPPPLPNVSDAELIARAAVVEGDRNNPQSWQNVAGVILNRMHRTGKSAAEILAEPNQFEAYGNGHIQSVDPNSDAYKAALSAIQPVMSGAVTVPYDSFYNDAVVRQRGHGTPPFDPATGTRIGTQLFGNGYQPSASFSLSPEDDALWGQLQGGRTAQIDPTKGYGGGGQPSNQLPASQQDAFKFLELHGFRMDSSPPGSSTNPTALPANLTDASVPAGQWYVNHQGQLRRGGEVTDYLPQLFDAARRQTQVATEPFAQRATEDVSQGVVDTFGSINKLTGGAFSGQDPTYATTNQLLNRPSFDPKTSLAGFDAQRNQFNVEHALDPAATPGRVVGQMVTTGPIMGATGRAVGAGGEALSAAFPRAAPVIDFALGNAGGNPLLRLGSRAVPRAAEGAGYSALTSETSDRPVAEQMAAGAVINPIIAATGLGARAAANRIVGGVGSQTVSPAVADLADTAVNKYKIPLRPGQILGANGDEGARYTDAVLLGRSPKLQANADSQGEAFTRAYSRTFGEDTPSITPDVLQRAKDRLGGIFNGVAHRTAIGGPTDPIGSLRVTALTTTLDGILNAAGRELPDSEITPLRNQIADIKSAIKGGQLSGDSYQALTRKGAPLDRLMGRYDSNIRFYAGDIREALDDALEHAASPHDVAALRQARSQYKAMMTVAPLVRNENVNGLISPQALNGAVNRSYTNRAFTGAGEPGELAQIGQTFLKPPPQSGTEPRQAARGFVNGDTVLPLGGLGGGLALGEGLHDPWLAVKGVAAGLAVNAVRKGASAVRQAMLENAWGPNGANRIIGRSLNAPLTGPVTPTTPLARALPPAGNLLFQQMTEPQPH